MLCSDDSLYTGISNDVDKRYKQHSEGKGTKYFRGRKPKQLMYLEGGHDRSSASKRESLIKKLSRTEKIKLIGSQLNELPQR